ncbi:MAG: phosphatase PAP2 family protein [Balneolaceae bacterium]|nr:MAG: phosphatase PAP2 family protein [Balneolaceae bacterium]
MPLLDSAGRQIPKLKKLLQKEFLILFGFLFLLLFVWGGIELRELFIVDRAQQFDEWMLLSFRDADNLQYLFGPHWVDEAVRDITALGGPAVLTFMIAIVTIYLLLRKKYKSALLVVVVTIGGLLISLLLKDIFLRERPDIVPALMVETSPSFPSGHSMLSAVVYLTLGSLLSRIETNPRIRVYIISIAILTAIMIGLTRIMLGVHFPTDVLVGWIVGFFWATLCWFFMMVLQEQKVVEKGPELQE